MHIPCFTQDEVDLLIIKYRQDAWRLLDDLISGKTMNFVKQIIIEIPDPDEHKYASQAKLTISKLLSNGYKQWLKESFTKTRMKLLQCGFVNTLYI